jgi:O-antigen ligase
MKKQVKKTTNKTHVQGSAAPPLNILFILILLSYIIVTVITPSLGAADRNGPKFLFISLLNLFSFLAILAQREYRDKPNLFFVFFRNKIGMAYTILMGVILLSFVKSINLPESVISFAKYMTVFSSAYIISIIFLSDKRYFRLMGIALVFLLVFDSFTVFYNILLYISGKVTSISEIKTVYANKNILAAALFVKISFALWLANFEKGWLSKLGYFALFSAELAILFMSARAFYLGLIFLIVIYSICMLFQAKLSKNRSWIRTLVLFLAVFTIAFLSYTVTQKYLFPKNSTDIYNTAYTERLSSISQGEDGRLDSWKRSAILFKQNPLLGVGTGNWKICVLKYENPTKSDFTFMIKAHNDFIEIFTETGIIGGAAFIFIFVFLIFNFLKAFFKPDGIRGLSFSDLFLPAFGIFCYSFDAFFNYPADRPEIQLLFAVFVGSGIAFSSDSLKKPNKPVNASLTKLLAVLYVIIFIFCSYILLLLFNSLKMQLLVDGDIKFNNLNRPSHTMSNSFPIIPNVAYSATPIAVYKSRYLLNEQKYQEAIDLLRPDKSSPYMGWREYFIAQAFSKMGNNDSALVYAYKANSLKPMYYNTLEFICSVHEGKGEKTKAIAMLEGYVAIVKSNPQAWLRLVSLYQEVGYYKKAVICIDSASKFMPGDSLIAQQKSEIGKLIPILPFEQTYFAGMNFYNLKNFQEALKCFNQITIKSPEAAIVYARQAYCYYNANEYLKCIGTINKSLKNGNDTPDLYNLRGICYHFIGDNEAACEDFQLAISKGDPNAANNAEGICKGK